MKIKTWIIPTLLSALAACGGGGGGGGGGSNSGGGTPAPQTVTISGTISFDKVPSEQQDIAALDYNNIINQPARSIEVQLLDSDDEVLATTTTDSTGGYSFSTTQNTTVRVVANAHLSGDRWSIKVTDNTQGNALYTLQGSLASSGTANSVRDLRAASGWTGSAYTETRSAGPFAILDTAYTMVSQISNTQFPAVEFRWSENNRAVSGNLATGDIGTSFYTVTNGLPTGYVLGRANLDTDEYDEDVIAHEFTHYLEDQISRSNSIGGAHGQSDQLDMRVAFSEGLANAFSGIVNGNPYYADSSGQNQAGGFSLDLENNNVTPNGWYSEASLQALLYDIADSNNEAGDNLSLSFDQLMQVMIHPSFSQNPALTSIYTFEDSFKSQRPNDANALDTLLNQAEVFGRGPWGNGESNSAFSGSIVLPVYTTLVLNSTSQVCVTNNFGLPNKLSNRRFLSTDSLTAGNYQINVERVSGRANSDPDFFIFTNGRQIGVGESTVDNRETGTVALAEGTHVIEILDFTTLTGSTFPRIDTCFDVTLTAI